MAENEYPKKVKTGDLEEVKGLYTVLCRNGAKQAAKIIGTKKDGDELRIVFEFMTEPDKGCTYSAKYDDKQEIIVYNEDTLLLAGLGK